MGTPRVPVGTYPVPVGTRIEVEWDEGPFIGMVTGYDSSKVRAQLGTQAAGCHFGSRPMDALVLHSLQA